MSKRRNEEIEQLKLPNSTKKPKTVAKVGLKDLPEDVAKVGLEDLPEDVMDEILNNLDMQSGINC